MSRSKRPSLENALAERAQSGSDLMISLPLVMVVLQVSVLLLIAVAAIFACRRASSVMPRSCELSPPPPADTNS
ncbi:hypothetical protein Tcan_08834 [Toxocara canis]|uniref:Transmembrane protein n=1 Tax=Toxocara canis TaxID=6265 RepID=A0A0B2ULN0_TOXCA|nr:hypothetical protein Tcan_08834 [Toxocara canis]